MLQITMMEPSHINIHPRFKCNGTSFSKEELKQVGYSFIKEGDAHELAIGNFLLDWLNDKPFITVQTSGSTGVPKRMEIQKGFMVNSALATGRFFNLEEGQTALLCLPADFIAGKMMLVRAMVLGLELDCVEPSSRPLENLNKSYEFCAMVPMQLGNSLDCIEQVKTLIIGGAPMSFSLKNNVRTKSTAIFETYGMTETVTHIAARQINGVSRGISMPGQTRTVENHFKTLPDIRVSKDQRDCLVIDCPKVAQHPVVTNDVVNIVSEREFEWLGRHDNIINSGGIKLVPEQIEDTLRPLIKNRFFVAGVPDEKLGQKAVLVIEGNIDTDKLQAKIRLLNNLKKFEVPKEIFKVQKFKETGNGKVMRGETLNWLLGHTE